MAYPTDRTFYVTAQPAMVSNPFHELNGEWTVGLCSCCDDVSRCCYAYWCWGCFFGSLAGMIDESQISRCCVPGALGFYRMKVRSILKIRGDACNDYCVTTCCPFCAALQMVNELDNRGLGKSRKAYEPSSIRIKNK